MVSAGLPWQGRAAWAEPGSFTVGREESRTFELPGFSRLLLRVAPFYVAAVVLGSAAVTVVLVVTTARAGNGAALVSVTLFLALFWALLIVMLQPYRHYARTVRQLEDGTLQVTTAVGSTVTLRRGQVQDVREQGFYPHPGAARVRTADDRTLYFGHFEDKYVRTGGSDS